MDVPQHMKLFPSGRQNIFQNMWTHLGSAPLVWPFMGCSLVRLGSQPAQLMGGEWKRAGAEVMALSFHHSFLEVIYCPAGRSGELSLHTSLNAETASLPGL